MHITRQAGLRFYNLYMFEQEVLNTKLSLTNFDVCVEFNFVKKIQFHLI